MSAAEFAMLLGRAALASSVAIALVWLLRRPLRRGFGAASAYAAWLAVPASLVAVLAPLAGFSLQPHWIGALAALPTAATAAPASPSPVDPAELLLAIWIAGVAAMAVHFALQQRRFHRALGHVHERADGTRQASVAEGLPAAMGLWRPRIVVPLDFDQRYNDEQRELMRAHESTHIRRGDLQVNAFAAGLRCLFWFNPLVHVAAVHFRHDQQLACDQRVMARYPQSRRAYGEAMLKTQLAGQPLPLGCHWGYSHPLKERIEMLKQPVVGLPRWIAGTVAVTALTLAMGVGAWAAQPGGSQTIGDIRPGGRMPPPRYPAGAAEQGIGGKVVLLLQLDARGKVSAVEVESSQPAGVFDQAAIDAARNWTLNPPMQDGKPVAGKVRVPVSFEPDPPAPPAPPAAPKAPPAPAAGPGAGPAPPAPAAPPAPPSPPAPPADPIG
ncbi:TonB family protein [Lysobacter ciconiae]|uniref:TonB family protein n=1 Tax=Novilysobacter ciconiae TaxID=2781022 RepID=A0A7S6UGV9_9GAMM|nr:TonB family protein [Lysobacter ciconiae]QOW20068.1 TonB family protein [Lysobacter ciconiae]